MGILILILILHLFCKAANCAITVIPTDTEVLVNQPTYLNCSTTITSQEVAWYRYRVGDPYRRHDVYDAGIIDKNYRDRFKIDGDKTKGIFNLVISRVLEEDAGKYECQDNGGIGDKRSAELVVLDSNGPVCQLNTPAVGIVGPNDCGIEPATLEFSCGVKFHGNIAPQLEWIMEIGSEEKKFPPNSISSNSTVKEVTCNLTVKAEQQMNGSSIVCKTKGSTSHRCAVDDVKVLYAFKYEDGVPKTLNDQVTCVANSSQPCTYKWKWFEWEHDVTIARDSELKAEREGWYRCEAECQFGTNTCRLVAMVIHVFPPLNEGIGGAGHYSNTAFAVLATVVAFLLIVCLFLGIIVYRMYQKQSSGTTGNNRVDMQTLPEEIENLLPPNVSKPIQVQETDAAGAGEKKEKHRSTFL